MRIDHHNAASTIGIEYEEHKVALRYKYAIRRAPANLLVVMPCISELWLAFNEPSLARGLLLKPTFV
jgi:hypothetical protein